MASRVQKAGTIFTRLTGLLKTGTVKWEDRPLWYDVYAAFPPTHEPSYLRPPVNDNPLRDIFYPEDVVRAKFYKQFGSPGVFNLSNEQSASVCQKFVEKFYQVSKNEPLLDEEKLFDKTVYLLQSEGVTLKRSTEGQQP